MRLRHRITLERSTSTQDDAGQPVEAWQPYRTCWASVVDGGSSQGRRGDQEREVGAAEVTIRYPREDARLPVALDRVRYLEQAGRTRTLNVDGVRRMDGKRRFVVLSCSEGPPNG